MTTLDDLLSRGVDKIYPSKEELEKVLRSGKKLRVYQGFDPTSPVLHIGHMVGLRKLKQWQDLGHKVIFLIGDFTGMIGDPSGKDSARKPLTHEQVLKNAQTYKNQASRILRFTKDNPVQIMFNNEWLSRINGIELLKLAENFTQSQFVERDMFQNRIKKGRPIPISEFLYPLLQAYDSVAMIIDVEVGGSDQTFNMLMGRQLVRAMQDREKFVMTTPLLVDSQGLKIGKTEGNAIAIDDKPSDLFAKIMALGDDVIVKGFEYLTDIPMDEVKQITVDLKGGRNPMSYKKMLAFEIVKQLSSHEDAHKAQQDFEKVVQKKEILTEAQNFTNEHKGQELSQIATKKGLVSSNSEWKRLIAQGGIKVNGETLKHANETLSEEITLQRGRKVIIIKPI